MDLSSQIGLWTAVFAGLSAAAAAVSAIVSMAAVLLPMRVQRSQRMLDQAIQSLERAYEVLSASADSGPPIADRLAWLTAGRLLQQYEMIKGLVIAKEHKLVLVEQEEYWRHRFYVLLAPLAMRAPSYYSDKGLSRAGKGRGPIEPMSAVVVNRFAHWPDGKLDPLPTLERESLSSTDSFLKGNVALREYLVDGGYLREPP